MTQSPFEEASEWRLGRQIYLQGQKKPTENSPSYLDLSRGNSAEQQFPPSRLNIPY